MKLHLTTFFIALFPGVILAIPGGYEINHNESVITIKGTNDQVALVYNLKKPKDLKLPLDTGGFFHPVRSPSGKILTVAGDADHPHHRGVFLGWVEMHGKRDADFWGWGEHAPIANRRIVNQFVGTTGTRRDGAWFDATNDWLAEDQPLLRERLQTAFRTQGSSNIIDLTYTLTPDADLTIARWAFSGFCVRLPKEGKLVIDAPQAGAKFPTPVHTKPETGWPAAKWYGYTLQFDDSTSAGIAVIDHPKNPPSLWHNHTGIRMLNPAICAPAAVTIKANTPLVLRYRVVVHDGPADAAALDKLADDFAK